MHCACPVAVWLTPLAECRTELAMIGMLTALVTAQVLPINDATIGFSSKSVLAVMAVRFSSFGPNR